jgi:hypothetical protein
MAAPLWVIAQTPPGTLAASVRAMRWVRPLKPPVASTRVVPVAATAASAAIVGRVSTAPGASRVPSRSKKIAAGKRGGAVRPAGEVIDAQR